MKRKGLAAGLFLGLFLVSCAVVNQARPASSPFLARMQAEGISQTVNVAGVKLHYLTLGTGSPVILLPGGGMWAYDFYPLAIALSREHTVYVLDTPGNGYTVPDANTDLNSLYTFQGMDTVLLGFMNQVNIDRADFVGNSWGGGYALYFAQQHPERVRKYVSIAGTGLNAPASFIWRMKGVPILGETMIRSTVTPTFLAFMVKPMYQPHEPTTEDIHELFLPYARPWNYASQWMVYRSFDWEVTRENLSRLQAPTLVLWGEKDNVLHPQRNLTLWNQLHPEAKTVVIPGAGHLPHQGQPELVARLILDFLR